MFGGHGLYVDDHFLALVADETLYLKADDTTKPHFEQAGCRAFTFDMKDKPMTMSYWSVPPEAMESPAFMQPWVALALAAALRAQAGKRKPRARKTSRGAAAEKGRA